MILHEKKMEHIVGCDECRALLAKTLVKELGEKVQTGADNLFEEWGVIDKQGFIQAECYSLLSSFLLSVSIKILEINKVPEKGIDAMCAETIDMAFQFSEIGDFKGPVIIKTH